MDVKTYEYYISDKGDTIVKLKKCPYTEMRMGNFIYNNYCPFEELINSYAFIKVHPASAIIEIDTNERGKNIEFSHIFHYDPSRYNNDYYLVSNVKTTAKEHYYVCYIDSACTQKDIIYFDNKTGLKVKDVWYYTYRYPNTIDKNEPRKIVRYINYKFKHVEPTFPTEKKFIQFNGKEYIPTNQYKGYFVKFGAITIDI